jgi:hypothetical protein
MDSKTIEKMLLFAQMRTGNCDFAEIIEHDCDKKRQENLERVLWCVNEGEVLL